MSKHPRTIAPMRTEHLDCVQTHCINCGGTLWQLKTTQRTLVTLAGVIQLHLTIRACHTSTCPQQNRPLRPEAEGALTLPRHEFGLDLIAQIGAWRYRDHRTVPEMHTALIARQIPISKRSVTNLLTCYDALVALHLQDRAHLHATLQARDHVVLAIDGLQPDVGHEVFWVIRECISGTILLARSLVSATAADLATLLTEAQQVLDRPITVLIFDERQSIRQAVEQALPGVPYQHYQFHSIHEATAEMANTDHPTKKESKKWMRKAPLPESLRGIRCG